MKRYLYQQVKKDLKNKMVFLSGPRQIGKTTLARQILTQPEGYLNWDIPKDQERILQGSLPNTTIIVLDELHKYSQWRGFLKGLVDNPNIKNAFLITGSGNLSVYNYGGDSLQGRHWAEVHPLSVAELHITQAQDLESLLKFGGFPEPFFKGQAAYAKRWSQQYRQRLLYEDVRTLETVKDISQLELLVLTLPRKVGSILSINALQEDLSVSFKTVDRWITILEKLFLIFRIAPFGPPLINAVKKGQKHYHYDWSLVPEEGPRFENMVACHLFKWVNFVKETEGREVELRYFKDDHQKEVDFVIVEDREPIYLLEIKTSSREVSKTLIHLKTLFPKAKAFQIQRKSNKNEVTKEGVYLQDAVTFLKDFI